MESKFKAGQKVYCIMNGVGIVSIEVGEEYPVSVLFKNESISYTEKGFYLTQNTNPTLLTLEEARAKGYEVPKMKVIKEEKGFMNIYPDGERYVYPDEITSLRYKNQEHVISGVPVTIKYEIEE